MEGSKWTAAMASIWIQSSGGAYTFAIYSPILKSSQGYDQSTLDKVSVFKDIGSSVGVLSGILFAAVCGRDPPRFLRGPWVVHAAGALLGFVGYFFLWLAVTGVIPRPHVAVVCLFMFIASHSQTFFNTANVITAVLNFPAYSGTTVGIMKGFSGLSGAIIVQIYRTISPGKPATFLLMLSVIPSLTALLLMFLVQPHPTKPTNHEKTYLNSFSLISIVVAAYAMCLIIIQNTFTLSPWMQASALSLLLILLSSPLLVAVKANKHDSEKPPSLDSPLLINTDEETTDEVAKLYGNEGSELNAIQAMGTLRFWLLFVAMVCGTGSGLATINNISQIGESLGYTEVERSTLVSLWSIWNFLGRFGAGFLSDMFLHDRGWARPLFMAVTLGAMTVGHVIIGSGFPGNLYVGSVLVGICYGSQWSLMVTITSEIFGVKHMGTIFNIIAIASPLGSYIISVRTIGYIYDGEAGVDGSCVGSHCFMLSFFIMAAVSLFGCLVALVLFVKTRGVYARIVRSRTLV